jgi:hypothetical protein
MYEYTTNLRNRMAKAHAYVRWNIRSAVDCQRQAYYKDRFIYQPTQFRMAVDAQAYAGPVQEVCAVLDWTVAD